MERAKNGRASAASVDRSITSRRVGLQMPAENDEPNGYEFGMPHGRQICYSDRLVWRQ